MNSTDKDLLFEKEKVRLADIAGCIKAEVGRVISKNDHIEKNLHAINDDNKLVQQRLLAYGLSRVGQLEELELSPYFVRCVVEFDGGEQEELHFAKFSFTDERIYSWITPASSIRFESPGKVSYTRPSGEARTGMLIQKDQYMIVKGKIVFFATESTAQERELVYQEYFSNQKTGFVLPEIVAQMEKAQDAVIRASHVGALVISGPAGSGKTTLALHRVAYLTQSPDVSDQFSPSTVVVFVQDEGSRTYFSGLLPQLGINGVSVVTFAGWAMEVLELEGYEYEYRIGDSEIERDVYEFRKREAMRNIDGVVYKSDPYKALALVYENFSAHEMDMFEEQKQQRVLDRFDVTILLMLHCDRFDGLTMMQDYYKVLKNQESVKKIGRFPVQYSLAILDEFQNYLPEQISLVKEVLEKKNSALMYVGDMAQQTQFGTIRDWQQVGEVIPDDRLVSLHKVFRNTRLILEYISSIGYDIVIEKMLREGTPVIETVVDTKEEEIAYVRSIAETCEGNIGVLSKDKAYLRAFAVLDDIGDHVHVMSIDEAQGVEFEVVCVVGVSEDMFVVEHEGEPESYIKEKMQINKDLLYVALTRAMNSLYIVGSSTLKEAIRW